MLGRTLVVEQVPPRIFTNPDFSPRVFRRLLEERSPDIRELLVCLAMYTMGVTAMNFYIMEENVFLSSSSISGSERAAKSWVVPWEWPM